jgi:hypothetical protein
MCGKDEARHVSNGMCFTCYNRQHVAKWREQKRDEGTLAKYTKRWQEKSKNK